MNSEKNYGSEFCQEVCKDIHLNWNFIKINPKAQVALDEQIKLINDVIDYTHEILRTLGEVSKRAYFAFQIIMTHVVMPLSYGILCNLLIGNLPACYGQMRIILEGLVKALIADTRFPDYGFFKEKLDKLEALMREAKFSFQKLCNNLMPRSIVEDDIDVIINLWRDLSSQWVHAKGISNKIVDKLIKHEAPPPWSIIVPIAYDERDIPDLTEFADYIRRLRVVINILMRAWKLQFIKRSRSLMF